MVSDIGKRFEGGGSSVDKEKTSEEIRDELRRSGAREVKFGGNAADANSSMTLLIEDCTPLVISEYDEPGVPGHVREEILAVAGAGKEGELFAIIRETVINPAPEDTTTMICTRPLIVQRYHGMEEYGSQIDYREAGDFVGCLVDGGQLQAVSIGREYQSGLGDSVSRRHMQVLLENFSDPYTGQITVVDSSTNGTVVFLAPHDPTWQAPYYVNGELVQST
jgi:hypothetical protein